MATPEHCAHCFTTILAHLKKLPTPNYPSWLPAGSCPLFVTWEIGQDEHLRGCIGTFEAGDLRTNLGKYANIAAFQDRRFNPVSSSEVATLTCKVSFLTNFEQGASALDWTVGTHGITVEFADPSTGRLRVDTGAQCSATFLPSVAPEQGWDKETTLKHLVKKAGYSGPLDKVINKISLTRYQSSVAKLTYADYLKIDGT